ncbi:hypothetical protein C1H46_002853 [Malus baccata]|uniref:CCHC-type domain-containing protein n=1 Tax=Malus baccata TaxID=106549 RepID=A0A540NKB8_MALBA|nr:hypothetical protein C1H46_002853 [Malus baccata]
METRPDPDIDDDFSELYKEYTGPPGSNATNTQDRAKPNKRSLAGSDEEEEARDPNAVPTDFTSREAKVWEAKSKATERNWKKRKEEEMICKICGEPGHFTQGCPSTLGASRKSQDFFERVPAREKHVRSLFTEKVINRIEMDIGCYIKMDEKFIIVGGKDRLVLRRGVDAVHKVIKEEGEQRDGSGSQVTRSRSPERSPVVARLQRSESQRSHSGPRNGSHFQQRFHRKDKFVEDRIRHEMQKFSRGPPQAYGNNGARGRPSRSNSPACAPYMGNSYNSYDGHNQSMSAYRNDGWNSDKKGSDMQSGRQFDYSAIPQTLEELEMEYKREAMELGRIRDKEEDEENYRHREAIREIRESHMKKLAPLRGMHAKQWEDFLQLDAQRRQQQANQQMSTSGFGGYKSHNYSEYDSSSANPQYARESLAMDSRSRYPNPNPMETYPSRPRDNFGEFQRQRHEGYGRGRAEVGVVNVVLQIIVCLFSTSLIFTGKNFQGPGLSGSSSSMHRRAPNLGISKLCYELSKINPIPQVFNPKIVIRFQNFRTEIENLVSDLNCPKIPGHITLSTKQHGVCSDGVVWEDWSRGPQGKISQACLNVQAFSEIGTRLLTFGFQQCRQQCINEYDAIGYLNEIRVNGNNGFGSV